MATLNQMVKYENDTLNSIFAVLADPTRRRIIELLFEGEKCVTEIADSFDMSLPAVSKHLRIIERAGLIARIKSGKYFHFKLAAGPMKNAVEWLNRYQIFWNTQLDSLEKHLNKSLQDSSNKEE
ncbi:MAG: ArsR/SmtB family transcription factor [Calditrichia bacterium]